MDFIQRALERPITVLVLVLGVMLSGAAALLRMPRDVFPNLDVPVIYVAQSFSGMDASQVEGYITYRYEVHFLYVSGIERIESRSIQGLSMMRLQFYSGTDMANAMAEVTNQIQRAQKYMPPGTTPPVVIRFDAGNVPVGSLVFSSKTRSEAEMQDLAVNRVRPMFASVAGVSAPPPFGGSERSIVVHLDPDRLRAHHMSAMEVVDALNTTNLVSPSGNARIGPMMPAVSLNTVVSGVEELSNVQVRSGTTPGVYIRDVATVKDASTIQEGYALVNGRRTVYIPVAKRAEASTLTVVNAIKEYLPKFQAVLPDDVRVSYEFDQSYFVTRSIDTLAVEGAMGAALTGLMVLLFLRDWRSALIVMISIPLSVVASLIGLWLTNQTVNIMTLGGLALAVGILVDEATVVIENIHTHLALGKPKGRAVLDATRETVVPGLLAVLCILAVFTPSFFMTGATRAMFVPLALAVGFSMIASFILSTTLVPILAIRLLKDRPHAAHGSGPDSESLVQSLYRKSVWFLMAWRRPVFISYLAVTAFAILALGRDLGTEIFPQSDEGQLCLRFKGPEGTRIEETEKLAQKILGVVGETAGEGNVEATLGYVGQSSADHPLNAVYLWTSGPEEGVLQVQLRRAAGIPIEDFKERLRESVAKALPGVRLSFEPSDLVSRVMSFGASTPVEIAVSGPDLGKSRETVKKLIGNLSRIPALRDLQVDQSLDYPAVKVEVDREKANMAGLTMKAVTEAFVPVTSTSRYIYKNLWPDPRTGVTYFVEVEVPEERVDSVEEIRNIPVVRNSKDTILLRDIAKVGEGTILGELDRYNLQRKISLKANISGSDLGRVAAEVRRAVSEMGEPPKGVNVTVRGQVQTMEQIFRGLGSGLVVTVVAIFLLLAANFQSFRLALVVTSTVPAVLGGVILMLLGTKTTLNIQSFMGAIMSVGVAVANAILLVTFAERFRRGGATAENAAIQGAASRLRPILMTSLAMVAGMIPMALGRSEGGSQAAPLGRAVIGGLGLATLATLTVLPLAFAMTQKRARTASPSLNPDNPESPFYSPPSAEAHAP